MVDEHPDSINDGWMNPNVDAGSWTDLPGSGHNGGCGFNFADGHSEIKHWLEQTTKQPVKQQDWPGMATVSNDRDKAWMNKHSSALR